jgi:hypothetical protein
MTPFSEAPQTLPYHVATSVIVMTAHAYKYMRLLFPVAA